MILDWPILNNRRENARSDHLGAERFFAAAAAIISLAAVASSYFLSSRTLATSRELSDRSVWQKANESELNNIQQRIEKFYNPNKQISEEIRIFSRDLRSRTDQNFVLLRNLFDRHWVESLDEGRRFLLDSIVEKAEKLDGLTERHGGAADISLAPYLARARAHYRVIRLASEGKLGADPSEFLPLYVYPKAINPVLDLEERRLLDSIDALRARPSYAHTPIAPLSIPPKYNLDKIPDPVRTSDADLTMPLK
ncbi:hypothetical protein [Aurantimonas coralicida]|uniref:hypothetical protein n=1 Tax=Aurantimonas coralicida TaxID=182270 RepID=UPI00165DD2CB|nr:hypothetical protein [Aurantimonas coralicida]MCC4298499.1 hypothetical protein [Aurantimonas coralicida]